MQRHLCFARLLLVEYVDIYGRSKSPYHLSRGSSGWAWVAERLCGCQQVSISGSNPDSGSFPLVLIFHKRLEIDIRMTFQFAICWQVTDIVGVLLHCDEKGIFTFTRFMLSGQPFLHQVANTDYDFQTCIC